MKPRLLAGTLAAVAAMAPGTTGAQGLATSTLSRSAASTEDGSMFTVPVGGGIGIPASATESTAGSGLIGLQYEKADRYFVSALFSLGTSQVLSGSPSDFGAALLNPSTQGLGFSAAAGRSTMRGGVLLGLAARGGVNATKWRAKADGTATTTVNGGVAFLTLSGQIGTTTLPWRAGDSNTFKFTLDAGYTMRALVDDLAQKSSLPFRSDRGVLGVPDTAFRGFELSFLVNLNDVQPFVRLDRFMAARDVSGFSGIQVTIGVNALAPLFKSR